MVGYLALIDILFLPYFPRLIMPYSLPILVGVMIYSARFRRSREAALVLVITICVFASAALSALFRDQATLLENTKRAFQLLSTFVYFFYFRWLFERQRLRVTPILVAFIVYFLVLVTFWVLDTGRTADWLAIIYPSGSYLGENYAFFRRFPYAFADPNTAAYFFLIAFGFLIAFSKRIGTLAFCSLSFAAIAVLIVTQSRGGMVALALTIAFAIYHHRRAVFVSPLRVLLIGGVAVVAGAGVVVWLVSHVGDSTAFGQLLKLLGGRLDGEQGSWQSGRTSKYAWVVMEHTLLPLGRGYLLLRDGENFAPHSDHLRFMFSYGFVAWVAVMLLLFRRLQEAYVFMIPALVAFSINSLVDEQKLFALFLIALGAWTSVHSPRAGEAIVPAPEASA